MNKRHFKYLKLAHAGLAHSNNHQTGMAEVLMKTEGNILLLFCIVKPLMQILPIFPILCVREKPYCKTTV